MHYVLWGGYIVWYILQVSCEKQHVTSLTTENPYTLRLDMKFKACTKIMEIRAGDYLNMSTGPNM